MPDGKLPDRWWAALAHPWTWRMAWRDSRSQRTRLLVFSLAIVAGITALVTIHLLRATLQTGLETQAKALLGADLHVSSRDKMDETVVAGLSAQAKRVTRETSFSSMLYFPSADAARLVLIRGLEGDYPYYGRVETSPPGAWERLRRERGIVLEPALLDQFKAKVGGTVKLGALELPILGVVTKPPPHSGRFGGFAPEAFVRLSDLEATGLLGKTSLAWHHVYLELPEPGLANRLRNATVQPAWKFETPADRREALGDALDDSQQFLSLVALAALVLGAIGVAGAIHAHLSRRITSVAILRCLGCPGDLAFSIYLAQAAVLALLGALAGALLAIGLHAGIVASFRGSLPVEIDATPSWRVVLETTAAGLAVCGGFALIPLLRVRGIPPGAALREQEAPPADRAAWFVWLALALLLTALNLGHGWHWLRAATITGAQALAFLILAATARALTTAARRLTRPAWPYLLRQGIANLHRPRNQTLLFLLSLGLGTFLIVTILLAKNLLLERVNVQRLADSPNLYLIDIQPDQIDGVAALLRSENLPLLESAPMVSMRIQSLRGVPVRDLEKGGSVPKWALQREFRSTWRAQLNSTEKIVAGRWISALPPGGGPIPISMENDIAKDLHVSVGDELFLDVQGVPVAARIASLREVDWSKFNLNFFMIFPPGSLEGAPGFQVMTTRVPAGQSSGQVQRALVKQFPNVSAIDLASILGTVRSVLEKVARVIGILAGFTVLAAVPILIGTLLQGREQRLKESVLLRTLGASARQIRTILAIEYTALGALSALTGLLLAAAANVALALLVFKASPWPDPILLATAFIAATVLSLLAGLTLSRGVSRHPPLTILRQTS